ncbi:MAG TPA: porin family protein [Ohtaekwangia sp.]
MKKILTLISIVFPIITHAQLWSIGGNAGVSFSNYKAKTPWKEVSNMGFSFGVKGFKQINANYGFTAELHYIQKGYFHKVCNDIYDQLEANYIEVPIMLDYSIIVPSLQNWKAHLNLGIYGAYWLSGKYKMKGFDETSEDFDFEKSKASRFDFGPNVGGRVEYILKNGSVSLDFRYELGLLDLQKQVNDNTKNTNRAFIVGVTYLKPLSR